MKNQLKQRIIGLIVLVATAGILFPFIFGQTQLQLPSGNHLFSKEIPHPPVIKSAQVSTKQLEQPIFPPDIALQEGDLPPVLAAPKPAVTTVATKPAKPVVILAPAQTLAVPATKQTHEAAKPINPITKIVKPTQEISSGVVRSKEIKKQHPIKQPQLRHIAKNIATARAYQKAWAVQLGSFSKASNAKGLVKKLQKHGLTAYIKTSAGHNSHKITRVFVGPEAKQLDAKKMQVKLKKLFKLNGMVVRYSL